MLLATNVLLAGDQQPIKVARSTSKAKSLSPKDAARSTSAIARPEVILSAGHKATCVKLVGDKIGDLTVTDINSTKHKLNKLLSDKLTVLVFWNDNSRAGVEQFRRIPVEILAPFAKHRVKVIAANVGGDLEKTKMLTGDAADKIVSLVDADQSLFKHFAKSRVPRTYLLDKNGKVLWFDIEYSQSMQRELENALHYYLRTDS